MTQRFGQTDNANINTVIAATGLILGAGSEGDVFGNPFTGPTKQSAQQLESASLFLRQRLKASVKRISFQTNRTASLSHLVISSIQPVCSQWMRQPPSGLLKTPASICRTILGSHFLWLFPLSFSLHHSKRFSPPSRWHGSCCWAWPWRW